MSNPAVRSSVMSRSAVEYLVRSGWIRSVAYPDPVQNARVGMSDRPALKVAYEAMATAFTWDRKPPETGRGRWRIALGLWLDMMNTPPGAKTRRTSLSAVGAHFLWMEIVEAVVREDNDVEALVWVPREIGCVYHLEFARWVRSPGRFDHGR